MIFKNQTSARVILQTDVNFSTNDVTTKLIKYKKPSGTTGSWTGTTLTGSETTGKIYKDFSSTDKFDEAGTWDIWAHLTFTDTRVANGAVVKYGVNNEGE